MEVEGGWHGISRGITAAKPKATGPESRGEHGPGRLEERRGEERRDGVIATL